MAQQSYFLNSDLPPSQEFGIWGWVRRNILGTGRGKFRSNPQNYFPVSQKVVLVDVSPGSLMTVAAEIPHLNTVISTGAEIFSMMQIKHVKSDGTEIENSPVVKFLRQPNPVQSMEQYLYQFYVLNCVYGKTFQYMVKGLSYEKVPNAMWLLPSGWMKINTTGKIYRQSSINDIIQDFELLGEGIADKYDVENTIYMPEGIGNNILNPISRIEALQIPLSNIQATLKSRNTIITERGMIGFIASDSTSADNDGALPLDEKESRRMRAEYQKQYSLDGVGGHVAFTHTNIKWVPMTFDVKQLQLSEGLEDDFSAIVAAFRHDRDLYPSVKGATFENKSAGLKSTIQNGIQPLANKLMSQLSNRLLPEGEQLVASYTHLPSMKEDERTAAQGKQYMVMACSQALKDGVISHDQYAEICEFDMDGDGVIKFPSKQPQPDETQV